VKNLLRFLSRNEHPTGESLSALSDGTLSGAELTRVDAHVSGCERCKAEVDGFRRIHAALASLPEVETPRSFRLREADVRAPVRAQAGGTSIGLRLAPFAGAAAVLVFAAVVVADIGTRPADNRMATLSDRENIQMSGAGEYTAEGSLASPADGTTADDDGSGAGAAAPEAATAADSAEPTAAAARSDASELPDAENPPADTGTDGDSAPNASQPRPEPSQEGRLEALQADDDGGASGRDVAFRVAEFGAAAIAVIAGIAFIVSRRRGAAS
jgi:hypothetical protein